METRPFMFNEMKEIGNDTLKMAEVTEQTILSAMRSLKEKDVDQARFVLDSAEEIDDMESEINDRCFKFLATQQPLAGDLRYCISIMKITRDLERVGDHCESIAKYTIRMENEEYIKDLIDIPRMAEMASRMVKNSIDAFINRDLRLARKVWKADEEVDEMFRNIYDELLGLADQDSSKTRQSIMFLFIASHLERIADYATNICEETVFVLEGTYEMNGNGEHTERM